MRGERPKAVPLCKLHLVAVSSTCLHAGIDLLQPVVVFFQTSTNAITPLTQLVYLTFCNLCCVMYIVVLYCGN